MISWWFYGIRLQVQHNGNGLESDIINHEFSSEELKLLATAWDLPWAPTCSGPSFLM